MYNVAGGSGTLLYMNTISIPQYTGNRENRFQETQGSCYRFNILKN